MNLQTDFKPYLPSRLLFFLLFLLCLFLILLLLFLFFLPLLFLFLTSRAFVSCGVPPVWLRDKSWFVWVICNYQALLSNDWSLKGCMAQCWQECITWGLLEAQGRKCYLLLCFMSWWNIWNCRRHLATMRRASLRHRSHAQRRAERKAGENLDLHDIVRSLHQLTLEKIPNVCNSCYVR